jgi:hypothetical protein
MQHLIAALLLVFLPAVTSAEEPSTRILDRIYTAANDRLADGQSRQAAEGFRVVADTIPELPEPNAALALALALSNWDAREDAVPYLRRALAVEPANPVAGIIAAIADPALSVLRTDGSLYLTPRGLERLTRAGELLATPYPGLRGTPHGLARFAASSEPTEDAFFPRRIARFQTLVREASFGAMFVVDVPPARLAVYDARIVGSMRNAVATLAANQRRLEDLRARLGDARAGLAAFERSDRLYRIAMIERRATELEASAAEREQRLAMLVVTGTSGASPDLLRRERDWIDALNRAAAQERRQLEAVRAGRE